MQLESAPQHDAVRIPAWVQSVSLALLAAFASVSGLRNRWVQDDLPIIVNSATVHTLAHPWAFFNQAWWPAPYPRELYRPLASALVALQWMIGAGSPMVFRLGSYLLYIVATLALFQLGRRLLGPTGGGLAAALFAVHPVHVEAVAVAVNQGELVVGLLTVLLVMSYLRQRASGEGLTGRWISRMAVGYAAASLFKESGAMIPALFVAAEFTVIHDARTWRERLAALRPLYLVLVLVALAVIEMRSLALGGNVKGTFTAEALDGLGIGGRALTMLGVVPIWARLLIWPEHLQADYSPQEIVAATHWGSAQTLGAVMVIAVMVLAWVMRRRNPVVTFLVIWLGVALFPVSNVLVPSGIVVAERTLFGASIAVVLLGGVALGPLVDGAMARGSVPRIIGATAVACLLGMGVWRSALRQLVWFDVDSLWHQTIMDAPLSYRAHHTWGEILFKAGAQQSGAAEYRRAIELHPTAWPIHFELAEMYRRAGQCYPAVKLYRSMLVMAPQHSGGRASLVACLVFLGDYQEAIAESRLGVAYGQQVDNFRRYEEIADSARRVSAPAGSVRLPAPSDLPTPK